MADAPDDPVTQMNVRVPRSLIAGVDARRAITGQSRDKWITETLTAVLHTPEDPE